MGHARAKAEQVTDKQPTNSPRSGAGATLVRTITSKAARRAGAAVLIYTSLRLAISAVHYWRRHQLRILLHQVCAALEGAGATYWVDFGSLLGIHRDGDLILYDNDVDLAILDPDWRSLLPYLQAHLPSYDVRSEVCLG